MREVYCLPHFSVLVPKSTQLSLPEDLVYLGFMERVFPADLPHGGVKFAGVNVLLGRWRAYSEIVGKAADAIDIDMSAIISYLCDTRKGPPSPSRGKPDSDGRPSGRPSIIFARRLPGSFPTPPSPA